MLRRPVFVIDCILAILSLFVFVANLSNQDVDAAGIAFVSFVTLILSTINALALLRAGAGPSFLKLYFDRRAIEEQRKALEEQFKIEDLESQKKYPYQRPQHGTRP